MEATAMIKKSIQTVKPFFDIVVIAASQGGVQALCDIISKLPRHFPVPIVIVQHRSETRSWSLDRVLGRRSNLLVKYALQGDGLLPGCVYIAPHDKHLLIGSDRTVNLIDYPKKHGVRPSADILFESAAYVYKSRVLAVVLTGGDADASEGVRYLKARGGKVLVQDEATSECFSMPRSAIETGCVDRVIPLDKIGESVVRLVCKGKFPELHLSRPV